LSVLEKIKRLKEERNAVILAHNYQAPEIQDMADFLGDSLDLCRKAASTDADYIVFCGVDFMAEAASILTGKKVLLPERGARCPMAAMLPATMVREAKARNPGIPVVLYVNTLAEAKAEADVICTSANMTDVINALESDRVIFGPDGNMAHYARKMTGKEIIAVPECGYCIVHKSLLPLQEIRRVLEEHSGAVLLAHPECNPDVQDIAHHIASTNGMVRLARELPDKEFIIATEEGLAYRLSKENPGKTFYRIGGAVCRNMKKTTPGKVLACLENLAPQVEVPTETAAKAKKAIERMMELSGQGPKR
jgi:quinolinate synthase